MGLVKNKNDAKSKGKSIKNQFKKVEINSKEPENHQKEEEIADTHLDSDSDYKVTILIFCFSV